MLIQEEIQRLIQYVVQQWERQKQGQRNPFPKLAYTETHAFECSEAYKEIKVLSTEAIRDMPAYKRETLLIQLEEWHQTEKKSSYLFATQNGIHIMDG
ncbi:hypothetical protein [Bacillus cereus]|uniref:hypothetical protein n=1 Tax=Bacillus cereus TaxID=1396 RepID=UPI0015CF31B5|nr:hypothetical protein [Bacillus cereus]